MSKKSKIVFYDEIKTRKFGTICFAQTERGLWCIHIDTTRERFLERLSETEFEIQRDRQRTAATRRELTEYFAGKRESFTITPDWSRLSGFDRRALRVCAKIPYGKTMSYGEVARRAGAPGGARAVGNAMGKNQVPLVIPCHRVIKSDGSLGGYGGGEHHKRALLMLEGTLTTEDKPRLPRRFAPPGFKI